MTYFYSLFRKYADTLANLTLILDFIRRVLSIWHDIPVDLITFKRLSSAMTNTVFILSYAIINEHPQKILFRVYGEGVEQILNRSEELEWFKRLSEAGVGPRLLATFANGRLEEYIESVTLTPSMMRTEMVSEGIARTMSQFHKLQIDENSTPVIWKRIEVWLREATKAYDSLLINKPEKREFLMRIKKTLILEEEEYESGKFKLFFDHLIALGNPIVPCHNDLQHGNILLTDTSKIVFIDYEYGGMNYAAFDIANHFCEWAGDFTETNPTPHLMNFTEKYPNSEEQEIFIRKYLGPERETEIPAWIEAVEKFKELSHLCWGLWGIIQENNSQNDFDYLGYSLQRLESMTI